MRITRSRCYRVAGLFIAALLSFPTPALADGALAWMSRGVAYYRAGALISAERAFGRAAAAAPASAGPALWLGVVEVARGNRAAAAGWFAEALRRHPSTAERGYAATWLRLLGVEVSRARWRVRTPEEYAAFIRAANSSLTLGQARWLGYAVVEAAARYGLDSRLLASVIYVESRFEHRSISPAGAEGLGQLMPGAAVGLGVDPRNPLQNLFGAAWLLRLNLDEFKTVPLALAAYNAGGPAVRRWRGIPPYPETQWYVWAVLWVLDGLRA
jgi:soluble lytic murein transglycosylase-like protein